MNILGIWGNLWGQIFQTFPHGEGGPPPQAVVDEGSYGREQFAVYTVLSYRSRSGHPSSVSLTRASSTFYGIAATGSYIRFNSLRDAPPEGEAFAQARVYPHRFTPLPNSRYQQGFPPAGTVNTNEMLS